MINNKKISTEEEKILTLCIQDLPVIVGYHGTTIQQIAMQAGVNKSAKFIIIIAQRKVLYPKVVKRKYLNFILMPTLKSIQREKDMRNQHGFF